MKEMPKMLKRAPSQCSNGSVYSPFCWAPLCRQTFQPKPADWIKGEKSWCWDFGCHLWAHRALPIVWVWHWHLEIVRGDKKTNKKSCLLISKLLCHWSQFFYTATIEPSDRMNIHNSSSLPPSCIFSPHPETCRAVFDWPWHLKRSLNKEKKSCLWRLENTTWSREGKKWHFERSRAPAYLNTNGCMKCAD